jgi:hypothetical protein
VIFFDDDSDNEVPLIRVCMLFGFLSFLLCFVQRKVWEGMMEEFSSIVNPSDMILSLLLFLSLILFRYFSA